VLTDRHQAEAAGRTLPEIATALASLDDIALVLREKDLDDEARGELATAVAAAAGDVPLILATGAVVRHQDFRLGHEVGAAGYHTASGFMLERGSVAWRGLGDESRRNEVWVGKSCHTTDDLDHALSGGATYVTVSPVFATASKPGYGPTLGPSGLADLVSDLRARAAERGLIPPPVYALGGVDASNAAACIEAGAHGVAVMGAVMTADDPAAAAAALVRGTIRVA
jgi:thiamine-phosphate pyrophosphorylase